MPNATVEYIGEDGISHKMEFTEDIEPKAISNFYEKYIEQHMPIKLGGKRKLDSFDF
tara:strand:+ start:1053 stop:1223 length:171 start_codon:yes stop_codon:yes gene_type:complete